MNSNATPLPLRSDTILGVCEAIGQDFGFKPLYLRLAFIAPLFVAPAATVAAYLAIGAVVGTTRLLVRDVPAAGQVVDAEATLVEEAPLPIAA
jgi:phage shock protein PspC (stress-responsive transcriptional regulator)